MTKITIRVAKESNDELRTVRALKSRNIDFTCTSGEGWYEHLNYYKFDDVSNLGDVRKELGLIREELIYRFETLRDGG